MAHQIVWCDIPVTDLARAIRFYSAVLGAPVREEKFPVGSIGRLPSGEGEIGACLYLSDDNRPSANGPRIYLNVQGRLDEAVRAVKPNGGKLVQPKRPIGPYGFRAVVEDSEGNRVALHSS
ncbi:MAG TPA: VOC family protein [Nitrospiria bacterium]|nr:VOC family protein [Nitrospiria bacterium]